MSHSLSTSIKDLATAVENADTVMVSSNAKHAIIGQPDDKLKFICDNKEIIFKAIDLAKIFTGQKGDKLLDSLKTVINSLCG